MAVEWSSEVNTRFYGMTNSVKENAVRIEYESGKVKTYLKNSTPSRTFSFSFNLYNSTEEAAFWNWYDNTLLSGSESFIIKDLLNHTDDTEYIMTSQPSVEGQFPKTVTLEVEEA